MDSSTTTYDAYIRRMSIRLGERDHQADAEDYESEMRFAAWRASLTCSDPEFVRTAIWNRARDLIRSANRSAAFRREYEEVAVAEYVPNLDRIVDFHRFVLQSPSDEVGLLLRKHLDGATNEALAEELGVSEWTIRDRLQKATRLVADAMKERTWTFQREPTKTSKKNSPATAACGTPSTQPAPKSARRTTDVRTPTPSSTWSRERRSSEPAHSKVVKSDLCLVSS